MDLNERSYQFENLILFIDSKTVVLDSERRINYTLLLDFKQVMFFDRDQWATPEIICNFVLTVTMFEIL